MIHKKPFQPFVAVLRVASLVCHDILWVASFCRFRPCHLLQGMNDGAMVAAHYATDFGSAKALFTEKLYTFVAYFDQHLEASWPKNVMPIISVI
jgi:hypothetical protein